VCASDLPRSGGRNPDTWRSREVPVVRCRLFGCRPNPPGYRPGCRHPRCICPGWPVEQAIVLVGRRHAMTFGSAPENSGGDSSRVAAETDQTDTLLGAICSAGASAWIARTGEAHVDHRAPWVIAKIDPVDESCRVGSADWASPAERADSR